MATRAERFKAEQERAHPPAARTKTTTRPVVDKKTRLERAMSGTVHSKDAANSGLRNLTNGKKAAYALEDSTNPTPSRKSTRRASKEGVKTGTALTSRQKIRDGAPTVRHTRGN